VSQAVAEAYELLDGIDFSIEGYSPEIGRYGGKLGIDICESVFMTDSRMAAAIVRALPNDLAVKRWELSLGVLDSMLDAADLSLPDRVGVCAAMRDEYAAIAGMDVFQVRRSLDFSYRTRRTRIEQAIAGSRQAVSRVTYDEIIELSRLNGILEIPLIEVVSSLMHMHLNRVLGVSQRGQEVVIYDYLRRHYRSEAAKARLP
jgi:thiopeptide-type bacteriocin biosynthesis protein